MTRDPTFDREQIDANPTWKLAWVLSEIDNDSAPLGWSRYIPMAECLMDHYEIRERPISVTLLGLLGEEGDGGG